MSLWTLSHAKGIRIELAWLTDKELVNTACEHTTLLKAQAIAILKELKCNQDYVI
jgi:hypothetical protein